MLQTPLGRWHRIRAGLLGVLVVAALLLGAAAALARALGTLHQLQQRATLQTLDALPLVLWAALVLALLWGVVLTVLAIGSLATAGGGRSDRDAADRDGGPVAGPLAARCAGLLLAATAITAVGATPALAEPVPTVAATGPAAGHAHHTTQVQLSSDDDLPAPDWVPTRPRRTDQVAEKSAPLVTGHGVADRSGTVVVHRGDTLWSIVADRLGPDADATRIAQEWPRWYAANRTAIGDDPDLLQVGASLHAPTEARSAR